MTWQGMPRNPAAPQATGEEVAALGTTDQAERRTVGGGEAARVTRAKGHKNHSRGGVDGASRSSSCTDSNKRHTVPRITTANVKSQVVPLLLDVVSSGERLGLLVMSNDRSMPL